MKIIHTNLMNYFWKKGIEPLKTELNKKIGTSKIVNNLLTTAAGFALDARQGKVLQDQMETKLSISKIVNNLTSTAAGFALDARQGKVLKDQVDEISRRSTWIHKDLDQRFPSAGTLTVTLSEVSSARDCVVRIGATSASYTVSSCDISVQQNAVKFGFQSPTSDLYFTGYVYRNGKNQISAAIYNINGFAASDIALLSIDYR